MKGAFTRVKGLIINKETHEGHTKQRSTVMLLTRSKFLKHMAVFNQIITFKPNITVSSTVSYFCPFPPWSAASERIWPYLRSWEAPGSLPSAHQWVPLRTSADEAVQPHKPDINVAAGRNPGGSAVRNRWAELKVPHDIRPLVGMDSNYNNVSDAPLTLCHVYWWMIGSKPEQQPVHLAFIQGNIPFNGGIKHLQQNWGFSFIFPKLIEL